MKVRQHFSNTVKKWTNTLSISKTFREILEMYI